MNYLLEDMEKWAGDSGYDTKRILGELEGTRGNVKDAIADAKLSAQKVKGSYEKKKFLKAKADVLSRRHEINTNRVRHLDRLEDMRETLEGDGKSLRHEMTRPNPDLSRVEQWRHQAKRDGKRYKELYDEDPKAWDRRGSYDNAFRNSQNKVWKADEELKQHKTQFNYSLADLKGQSGEIKKLRADNQREIERSQQNAKDGANTRKRIVDENQRYLAQQVKEKARNEEFGAKLKAAKRKEDQKLMLGLGAGAATIGGLYAYNRYKKKKRTQADQEKTARSIEGWDLAEEERLGKLWNSPEYKKKEIDKLRANYRKVGQKMPGDVNRRHRRMKIGALAVGGMAVGLGAQKLNRMYAQKKKRDQAEQEKTALLSDPDNLWKDQNKPPILRNALKPKKPHGTTGTVPDYVKGTGRKQPSPLTDLINSRKRY